MPRRVLPSERFHLDSSECLRCGSRTIKMGTYANVTRDMRTWRKHHGCTNPEPEWHERFQGETCRCCEKPITDTTLIHSIRTQPVHAECYFCFICRSKDLPYTGKPAGLHWVETYDLPVGTSDGLYHQACVREYYGEEAALFEGARMKGKLTPHERKRRKKAQGIAREPDGTFASFTVPIEIVRKTRAKTQAMREQKMREQEEKGNGLSQNQVRPATPG